MGAKILLTTSVVWPAAARLAGGFAAAGCTVDAHCPRSHPIRLSRYLSHRTLYDAMLPLASLRRAIGQSAPDLIVPCDDRAVAHLLRLYEQSPPDSAEAVLIRRSLGTPENYASISARNDFIAKVRAAGIATPETTPADSEATLDAALARLGLPAVLKQDASWGGDGVEVVNTREEALAVYHKWRHPPSRLRSLYRTLRRRDPNFLYLVLNRPKAASLGVQKFIDGHPATSAMACWQGKVLGTIHMDVVVAKHGKGPACVLRRRDCALMDENARRLAELFGLSGLHGIDYMRAADGSLHMLEVNPRATQVSYLPLGPGHDLTAALTGALTGQEVPARPALGDDTVALFPQEWNRDPDSPYLRNAYHDRPDDDPAVLQSLWRTARRDRFFRNIAGIPRFSLHILETLRP